MDYEKKYKEALERAMKFLNKELFAKNSECAIKHIFPELKESEDEKVRKTLVELVKCNERCGYFLINNVTTSSMLAWLEKQKAVDVLDEEEREFADNVDSYRKDMDEFYKNGYNADREAEKQYWLEKQGEQKPVIEMVTPEESLGIDSETYNKIVDECIYGDDKQKPVNKVEAKFKIGDYVVGKYISGYISEVRDDCYLLDYQGFSIDRQDNYHLWTIQDAKEGDVLHSPSHRLIWIYKDNEHYHACVNMNYVTENVATDGLISFPNDACPANRVQRSILFQKMEEAGYTWDTEKKELKIVDWSKHIKYEPNTPSIIKESDWSEEDEYLQAFIIELLYGIEDTNDKEYEKKCRKAADWLKSLKQRIKKEAV